MKKLLIALFTIALLKSEAQVNLSSSLAACYSVDGNANDPVNGLNGLLSSSTPTVDRNNSANSAYRFLGNSSSYVELPNSLLLKANAVSFSA